MAEAVPVPIKSVFVVHYYSPKESLTNVFIASDEDAAISYCLHWTSIIKFSKEPEWQLRIYERALDDIHTDWQSIITVFDQDGFTVDVPDIDIGFICRQIGRTRE